MTTDKESTIQSGVSETYLFRVADWFRRENGRVRIHSVDKEFVTHFYGMVEERPRKDLELCCADIAGDVSDAEIIQHFGGEESAALPLADLFRVLVAQPNGEEGVLLRSAITICFAFDKQHTLRVLHIGLCGDGNSLFPASGSWFIETYNVGGPRGWGAPRRAIAIRSEMVPVFSMVGL